MPERVFADVILPLAIPNLLTYEVPTTMVGEVAVSKRVIVQLGKQKYYSGIVRKIHTNVPPFADIKEIQSVIDESPIVGEKQFQLWEWISEYYLCHIGEVMNAALPAALKLHSETTVVLNPDYHHDHDQLSDKEFLIYEALLVRHHISLSDAAKILQRKSAITILKPMIDKGVVLIEEEVQERYKPKRETRISLAPQYEKEEAMKELFESLEKKSPKQVEALMAFLKLLYGHEERKYVVKSELTKNESITPAALAALIKKEVLQENIVVIDRLLRDDLSVVKPSELSAVQNKALDEIKKSFSEHDVTLLHGVTSSGKTEIYTHLIEETIKDGKQVLYLLPEIALTAQMINRLRKHFGSGVGVYHSRQNSHEKVEVWNACLNFKEGGEKIQPAQIVLGARSAIFLPYKRVGLIIVDEEHDSSYKQNEPAPRYHSRDLALVLARMFGAKTLLGSATPSLESFFNVREKKYGFVKLSERFGNMEMPEIIVCDIKEAERKRQMKSHFAPLMIDTITEALKNKEQVILFQNRRGFAPVLECKNCNWIPQCKNCSVTLTYHKQFNQLRCHYCGYAQNPPSICQRCGDRHLEIKGFGTEKIEEEIAIFFPNATIARLDLDSTRSRNAYQRIIGDFEERKIDILVGTQMVTKGLDFENVSTVGIINADQMLNFPDFRAHERSYQLMSQVSGRSGRKQKRGRVIIQTQQPSHWVILDVVDHNYEAFYDRDLYERQKFSYPPLTRLIEITLKHKDNDFLNGASFELADALRANLGKRVIGPHQALIARIRNLWQKKILIKIERESSSSKAKGIIKAAIDVFYEDKKNKTIVIVIDVDPA